MSPSAQILQLDKRANAGRHIPVGNCADLRINGVLLDQFVKPLIVRPRHAHINIIIPGNKALMAHRTEQRARIEVKPQPMPLAVFRKPNQQFKFNLL